MIADELKKRARRLVRYNAFFERGQQLARMGPTLSLYQIDLQLNINREDILIDCGANIGDVTSSFARTGAQVFAFEPNPLCFSILRKRFSITPNVKCYNQGVMDRDCTLSFATAKPHGKWDDIDVTVTGSFHDVGAVDLPKEILDIQCVSLSKFIMSLNKRVRLLKLDIEGCELEVINDLIDTRTIDLVELVIAETHEKPWPSLLKRTEALRNRISDEKLSSKIRLDWP